MKCCFCQLPLEGVQVGAGDGTGQRFAHPGCYVANRLKTARAAITEARSGLRTTDSALDLIEKEFDEVGHVLAVAL